MSSNVVCPLENAPVHYRRIHVPYPSSFVYTDSSSRSDLFLNYGYIVFTVVTQRGIITITEIAVPFLLLLF